MISISSDTKLICLALILAAAGYHSNAFAERGVSLEKSELDIRLNQTLIPQLKIDLENQFENKKRINSTPNNSISSPKLFLDSKFKQGIVHSWKLVNEEVYESLPNVRERAPAFLPPKSFSANTIEECSAAQSALIKFESQLLNDKNRDPRVRIEQLTNPYQFKQTWYKNNNLLQTELQGYKSVITEFNNKCLDKATAFNAGADKIKALVGVLSQVDDKSSIVECTAFRIAQNRIVTARHCMTKELIKSVKQGKLSFILSMNTPPERVTVLGETCALKQTENLEACAQIKFDSSTQDSIKSDYIVLEVTPVHTQMPNLNWVQPDFQDHAPITLVSWIAYPAIIEVSNQALLGVNTLSSQSEEINIPLKGYCSVAQANNACILHGCQSTSGSSGAPMLAWDESGGFKVVGIHVLTAGKFSNEPKSDSNCEVSKVQLEAGDYIGNVAIPLPESIIKIAKQ